MKKLIPLIILLPLIFSACKSKSSEEDEVQKLLDRQAELEDSQEESVEDLQGIYDSLTVEKQSLDQVRKSKDERMQLLEKSQQMLAEQLRQSEESTLASQKEALEENIAKYEDSISLLQQEMGALDGQYDSILNSMAVYEAQLGKAAESLESGISAIDERIRELERQSRLEREEIKLLNRKRNISDKKIEAYQLEKGIYAEERDELLRKSAPEEDIQPYRNMIARMDSIIDEEMANRQRIESELSETRRWIASVDTTISELNEKVRMEYDKQDIVAGFIESEKQRLQDELAGLKQTRSNLVKEQNQISNTLASTETKINNLDREMELVRSKDMAEILEEQASLEQTDAALADEEIQLLTSSMGSDMDEDTDAAHSSTDSPAELASLNEMSQELDSLRTLIQEEKAEVARTRMELAERRAETARKRATFTRTAGYTVLIIILGGVALLALFYYLGRRARKAA